MFPADESAGALVHILIWDIRHQQQACGAGLTCLWAFMPKAKFTPAYRRLRDLLVEAREAKGLRQVDVAKRLKRHQSYVSKVEAGEQRLDVVEFIQFAEAVEADTPKILREVIKVARG